MTGTNAIYLNIGGNSHASIYLTASNLSNVTGYNNAVNVPLVTGEIPQYNYKITYANGSTLEGIVGETGSAITNTWSNNSAEFTIDLGNGNEISQTVSLSGTRNAYTIKNFTITLNVAKQSSSDSGGSDSTSVSEDIPDNVVKIHFGSGNDSAEDYYYINKSDATTSGLGLSGVSIETQENAQKALVTIKDAIVKKDNIRAYYGAMQNRLENTMSNLTTQSENLQTAESRISDIDIAKEMTNFVKNQILTQAAVAMLSQANVMPQMAMRLIG
ncbi:MAG: flagellin [Desulfovibrionaceae bacterium]|nr:flagellin [Desulfovibrionaceae bacterium]